MATAYCLCAARATPRYEGAEPYPARQEPMRIATSLVEVSEHARPSRGHSLGRCGGSNSLHCGHWSGGKLGEA